MPSHKPFLIASTCLVCVTAFYASAAVWHDPTLPMADTEKPVLQSVIPGVLGVGGVHKKVRIPSLEDLKEQARYEYKAELQKIRIAEIRRGSWMFLIGCIAAGVGFALHFATAYPIAQRVSEWVLAGGLCLSGIGLVVKKAAEYQSWIVLGVVGCVVIFVLYKCKNWSLSHLITKPRESGKPNVNTNS